MKIFKMNKIIKKMMMIIHIWKQSLNKKKVQIIIITIQLIIKKFKNIKKNLVLIKIKK